MLQQGGTDACASHTFCDSELMNVQLRPGELDRRFWSLLNFRAQITTGHAGDDTNE